MSSSEHICDISIIICLISIITSSPAGSFHPQEDPGPTQGEPRWIFYTGAWLDQLLTISSPLLSSDSNCYSRPGESQYWPLISLTDENCCLAGLDAEVKGQIENQIGQIFPLMFLIKGKLTRTESRLFKLILIFGSSPPIYNMESLWGLILIIKL